MHPKTPLRRTHSPEFKARVLAACSQPGASIAAVALAHGINANVVHKWLAGIGMKTLWSALAGSGPIARCTRAIPAAGPERRRHSTWCCSECSRYPSGPGSGGRANQTELPPW
ncbi:MAG: transposase [Burkholderiales bacterium]|nr:transposase [Burkholderiales bacterium]